MFEKFISDKKAKKIRANCNACGKKTSIIKLKKKDGSVVARCNTCEGEHVVKRPPKK